MYCVPEKLHQPGGGKAKCQPSENVVKEKTASKWTFRGQGGSKGAKVMGEMETISEGGQGDLGARGCEGEEGEGRGNWFREDT